MHLIGKWRGLTLLLLIVVSFSLKMIENYKRYKNVGKIFNNYIALLNETNN